MYDSYSFINHVAASNKQRYTLCHLYTQCSYIMLTVSFAVKRTLIMNDMFKELLAYEDTPLKCTIDRRSYGNLRTWNVHQRGNLKTNCVKFSNSGGI